MTDYRRHYSEHRFAQKLKQLSKLTTVRTHALRLWELLNDPDTSAATKAVIVAALGYLICPVDLIPDRLPGGLVDDLAVLVGLLALLTEHEDDAIQQDSQSTH
jgi:uncharacterized membrane protein YkvA (DUF1232 family)